MPKTVKPRKSTKRKVAKQPKPKVTKELKPKAILEPKPKAIKEPKRKPEVPLLTPEQKAAALKAVRLTGKSVGTIAKELNAPKVRVQEVRDAWIWPKGVPDIVKQYARK